jgi:hypothetical protein
MDDSLTQLVVRHGLIDGHTQENLYRSSFLKGALNARRQLKYNE